MQKTNECRCKLTLCYTRFSIRSRRFRKQIPQAAQKMNLFPYENTMLFLAICFYSLQPLLFLFSCFSSPPHSDVLARKITEIAVLASSKLHTDFAAVCLFTPNRPFFPPL